MTDLIGRSLGPYEIKEEIGHGGMANVYRAVQPSIGREVAVKVLPAHFLQDRTFVERFTREVKVITKLQHSHILPVYDFGEQDGIPYIVMAYMPGGTLADRVQREGGLPLDEVARLIEQIAGGLDYAHKKGVIHRDFKPSNVLLDEAGNIHLADFGIAKVTEATAQLTGSGIVGTLAYMAPEMADQRELTPLVDVYALGVTLFQMLSGKLPYEASTPMGVLMAHANKPIPDVRQARPELSEGIQEIVSRALAKDPRERYQTCTELAADLKRGAPAPLRTEPMITPRPGAAHPAQAPSTVTVPATPAAPRALDETTQDLANALGFTLDDLTYNRAGLLSPRQRVSKAGPMMLAGGLLLAAFALYFGLRNVIVDQLAANWGYSALSIILSALLFVFGARRSRSSWRSDALGYVMIVIGAMLVPVALAFVIGGIVGISRGDYGANYVAPLALGPCLLLTGVLPLGLGLWRVARIKAQAITGPLTVVRDAGKARLLVGQVEVSISQEALSRLELSYHGRFTLYHLRGRRFLSIETAEQQ